MSTFYISNNSAQNPEDISH